MQGNPEPETARILLEWAGRNLPIIVAGAIGGLVRAIHRRNKSLLSLCVSSLAGATFAFYGSPVVGAGIWHWLRLYDVTGELTRTQIIGLAGFLCGVIGFPLTEAVLEFVRKKFVGEKS